MRYRPCLRIQIKIDTPLKYIVVRATNWIFQTRSYKIGVHILYEGQMKTIYVLADAI